MPKKICSMCMQRKPLSTILPVVLCCSRFGSLALAHSFNSQEARGRIRKKMAAAELLNTAAVDYLKVCLLNFCFYYYELLFVQFVYH